MSPLSFNSYAWVVSTQTNHVSHHFPQLRDHYFLIKVLSSLSLCWFFICGGEWRKRIIHCTVWSYFWCAQLRSNARRVTGPDYWVRFWVGRPPHHCLTAGLLVLMQDCEFLRRGLVLDRPNMSDFMCNLHGTPLQENAHSSFIRLISNAHKIHFCALNKTLFQLSNSYLFSLRSSVLPFLTCCL